MSPENDIGRGRSVPFEQALARQAVVGERRRATFVAALMGIWLVVVFVRNLIPDPAGDEISHTFWKLLTPILAVVVSILVYELAVRWLAGRCLAEDRPLPRWIPYFSAAIETSSATFVMLILGTQMEPIRVLQVSIPFTYFIAIIISILGLDFKLCLFAGFLAAGSYLAMATYWAQVGPSADLVAAQYTIHSIKAFVIAMAGICAAFIAAQLKDQFAVAIRAGEEARIALEAENQAREATRAKSVFLANMSHELRTPLNAVIGFAQLMDRDGELSDSQRASLSIISRSGEHLLELINDVLSLAKIEAGRLTLTPRPFDLVALLHSVEAMIRVRADEKCIQLRFELDDSLPRGVLGDEGKLRQVLINLLGNAVKFTDEGHVRLRARWAEGRAYVAIEDTGFGISDDEIGKLFEGFGQTESGRNAKESTGLGLSISRQIVRLMGGDVAVSSAFGKGSVFSLDVDLPIVQSAESHAERGRVASLAPGEPSRRILVVDDVEENRLLLVKLLSAVGFEVREAANGLEAVERCGAWRPALVWMDVRMAVMDGTEATRRIRAAESDEQATQRTRVIALTASAFDHERDAILSNGFDDIVTKPFREETIFEKLAEHLGVKFRYEERAGQGAAARRTRAELTPDRLATLPAAQIDGLHSALNGGDLSAARHVVEQIARHDDAIAFEIAEALDGFQIDELLTLIERIERSA